MTLFQRLRSLFRRNQLDRDMAEEMRFHLDERTDDHADDGMRPDEARAAAHRKFGGVAQIQERAREVRGIIWLEQLLQDMRYAIRQLVRAKGFTVVVILTLALGIGGTTAIFGVFDAHLLNPIPGLDADRLVEINEFDHTTGRREHLSAEASQAVKQLNVFEQTITLYPGDVFRMVDGDFVDVPTGCAVSQEFFSFFGIPPEVGSWLPSKEADPAYLDNVVISYAWWQSRFGGDPAVIGRQVRAENRSFTIVGVMPRHFQFPWPSVKFWYVKTLSAAELRRPYSLTFNNYFVFARLAPGRTTTQAQAALDTLQSRFAQEAPAEYAQKSVTLRPLRDFFVAPELRSTLWTAGCAAGLVLLIVCANVVNLQFARDATRVSELSIRTALGADRWRITRQLLTESILLSIIGGVFGLLLACWLRQPLEHLLPAYAPVLSAQRVSVAMLTWTSVVSTVCGVLCGLVSSRQSTRTSAAPRGLSTAMSASRTAVGLRHTLVVAQIALATVLLCGAGLLVRSVVEVLGTEPGLNPTNLARIKISLSPIALRLAPAERQDSLTQAIADRLAALPGTTAVGVVRSWGQHVYVPDHATPVVVNVHSLRTGDYDYLRAIGARLKLGRWLDQRDDREANSGVLVNETFAATFWPGDGPIGKRFYDTSAQMSEETNATFHEVVGVVADFNVDSFEYRPPTYYYPSGQSQTRDRLPRAYFVRTTLDTATLTIHARSILRDIMPGSTAPEVTWIEQELYASTGSRRLFTTILTAFAALGLFLAMIGAFGVLLSAVINRTKEIGIRLALGAQSVDVLAMVLRQGLRLVALGLAIGLVTAWAGTRLLRSQLYNVSSTDPITYILIVVLLSGAALLACYLPARRAAKVNPVIALRAE